MESSKADNEKILQLAARRYAKTSLMKSSPLQLSYIYNKPDPDQIFAYSEHFSSSQRCIGKNVRSKAENLQMDINKEKRSSFDSGTSSALISPHQTPHTSYAL